MTDIAPRQSQPQAPQSNAAQNAGANAENAPAQDPSRPRDGQPHPSQDPVISRQDDQQCETGQEQSGSEAWSESEDADPISLQDQSSEEEDEDDSQSPMDL
jgi:hypothetical protein